MSTGCREGSSRFATQSQGRLGLTDKYRLYCGSMATGQARRGGYMTWASRIAAVQNFA